MIVYTPDQIFDLLDAVNCAEDLKEIRDYLFIHYPYYSYEDLQIFQRSIKCYMALFTP